MQTFDFSSARILVTGASSGIGRATAIYLSQLGAELVLNGRNESRLSETHQALAGSGHRIFSQDLTASEDLSPLFDLAVEDGHKLTGLVHCAGVSRVLPLNLLTRERMLQEFTLNTFVYVDLIRMYAKKKYSSGGSIVGISSIASVQPEKCQTIYAASKAALNTITRTLALELAPRGIRVNAVLPGAVRTPMGEDSSSGNSLDQISQSQLFGAAEPEDIAAMCAFLLSDLSRQSTGRLFYADGGRL